MAAPADDGPAEAGRADADRADADRAHADRADADRADGGPAPAGASGEGSAPAGPARRRRWRGPAEAVITIIAALVLALVVRTFVFQTFWIPSSSMVPTLAVNDRIVVQKAFFSWHDVHTGDVVVFSHPPLDDCPGPQQGDLVKRVIALPGQTIYSSGSRIYVNGRPLAEPYLPAGDPLGPPIASRAHPYRVPPGELYLLGDNRAISCDSRYWGPIRGSTVIGKVVLVWWHDNHPEFRGF